MTKPQPWSSADATIIINALARDLDLDFHFTNHVRDRMDERGLRIGDILHVLKNGFVYEPAAVATREKFYKYALKSKSPNSGARDLCVIAIPDPANIAVKIVTIMWVDER